MHTLGMIGVGTGHSRGSGKYKFCKSSQMILFVMPTIRKIKQSRAKHKH